MKNYTIYIPAIKVNSSVLTLTEQELKQHGKFLISARLSSQIVDAIDQLNDSGVVITEIESEDKKKVDTYISLGSDTINDSVCIPQEAISMDPKKEV